MSKIIHKESSMIVYKPVTLKSNSLSFLWAECLENLTIPNYIFKCTQTSTGETFLVESIFSNPTL